MADQTLAVPQPLTLKQRAFDEFKRLLVIFIYLWVVFGMLVIHSSMVLYQRHLDYADHTLAIVNAFIFAKVLLIGEHLHLGSRFDRKSLIYPILYKCLVFTVLFILFHLAESVVLGVWHGHTIAESIPPLLGWNPKGILSVALVGFLLLLPFFGFREIVRVIGRDKMRALLFHSREHDPSLTLQ